MTKKRPDIYYARMPEGVKRRGWNEQGEEQADSLLRPFWAFSNFDIIDKTVQSTP